MRPCYDQKAIMNLIRKNVTVLTTVMMMLITLLRVCLEKKARKGDRGLEMRVGQDDDDSENSKIMIPHKDGVGTLCPDLNRLSRLVPCGKGDFTFAVKTGTL